MHFGCFRFFFFTWIKKRADRLHLQFKRIFPSAICLANACERQTRRTGCNIDSAAPFALSASFVVRLMTISYENDYRLIFNVFIGRNENVCRSVVVLCVRWVQFKWIWNANVNANALNIAQLALARSLVSRRYIYDIYIYMLVTPGHQKTASTILFIIFLSASNFSWFDWVRIEYVARAFACACSCAISMSAKPKPNDQL